MPTYKTIVDGVEALEEAMRRKEAAEIELAAAKSAVRDLQRFVLPPLFQKARQKVFTHEDGTKAVKSLGSYWRWPQEEPQHGAALQFMQEVGHMDSLKAVVTASWGKAEHHLAEKVYKSLLKDTSAQVVLKEDLHWKTAEKIVLDTFQAGKFMVPFDEIGAEVYDEVTITHRRETAE